MSILVFSCLTKWFKFNSNYFHFFRICETKTKLALTGVSKRKIRETIDTSKLQIYGLNAIIFISFGNVQIWRHFGPTFAPVPPWFEMSCGVDSGTRDLRLDSSSRLFYPLCKFNVMTLWSQIVWSALDQTIWICIMSLMSIGYKLTRRTYYASFFPSRGGVGKTSHGTW